MENTNLGSHLPDIPGLDYYIIYHSDHAHLKVTVVTVCYVFTRRSMVNSLVSVNREVKVIAHWQRIATERK